MRKYLRFIPKTFELQCIACRVADKICALLSRLTGKSNVGLYDKHYSGAAQTFGQSLPIFPSQDQSKMAHRDLLTVNCPGLGWRAFVRCKVRNDLVPMQVKIYPMVTAASQRTPDHLAIKSAGLF